MSAAITPLSDAERIDIALYALRRLQEKADRRPIESSLTLRGPACERQCPICYMECAIIPERIDWWERELESLGGIPAHLLRRDGI